MKLFGNLRLKIGQKALYKKLSKISRKVSYTNIDNVKVIGIVWDASKPDDFKSLQNFHLKMAAKGIDVKIIGFNDMKELPDQYTAIRYLTCLRKEDLNYFFKPISPESEAFMNEKFDVLIDINFNKVFPLFYITSMSRGGIKIGLYTDEPDAPFDVMIEQKGPAVGDYLEQVVHYLGMINIKNK